MPPAERYPPPREPRDLEQHLERQNVGAVVGDVARQAPRGVVRRENRQHRVRRRQHRALPPPRARRRRGQEHVHARQRLLLPSAFALALAQRRGEPVWVRRAVCRRELGELGEDPRDGEAELTGERGKPQPRRVGNGVGDAVPEEGGQEEDAQRDGRAVQTKLAGRDGQFLTERLVRAVIAAGTIPAANSAMARHGKAQERMHTWTRSSVLTFLKVQALGPARLKPGSWQARSPGSLRPS